MAFSNTTRAKHPRQASPPQVPTAHRRGAQCIAAALLAPDPRGMCFGQFWRRHTRDRGRQQRRGNGIEPAPMSSRTCGARRLSGCFGSVVLLMAMMCPSCDLACLAALASGVWTRLARQTLALRGQPRHDVRDVLWGHRCPGTSARQSGSDGRGKGANLPNRVRIRGTAKPIGLPLPDLALLQIGADPSSVAHEKGAPLQTQPAARIPWRRRMQLVLTRELYETFPDVAKVR